MLEHFPSWGTMIGFDIVFLLVGTISTVFVFRRLSLLRNSGAQSGAYLLLAGIWLITSLYVIDLTAMVLLPHFIGIQKSMTVMRDIHIHYAWYFTAAAQILLLTGLIAVVSRLLNEHLRSEEIATKLRDEISDREMVEEILRESENRSAQAAEIARLGHYVWDTVNDKCLYCSDTHAAFHGVTAQEYMETASAIDGSFALTSIEDREPVRAQYQKLRAGYPIEMEYGVYDGTSELRIREIAKPVFDENNNVVREIGTTLDVTELYQTQQKLAHSQRLETIGQLAGGVAHDFNNLLFVIVGNLELIRDRKLNKDVMEKVDTAIGAAQRGSELTKNLLSFARKAKLQPETLDLNQVIKTTKEWANRVLPSNITVKTSLSDGLWMLRADPSSLENAILNLLLNARDAMPDGGEITIKTENIHVGKNVLESKGEMLEPGRYVTLTVSDTGLGIEKSDLGEIFTPFFSTKAVGAGSGLGLSMVQGFVKQSGGTVSVNSQAGIGTTFQLSFKALTEDERVEVHAKKDLETAVVTGGKLLVVEDDPAVLDIIAETLENAGYRVETASSGKEALDVFEGNTDVDVLVTDIVMSGALQGTQLAQRIRLKSPDMPVVYLSGYANESVGHHSEVVPEGIYLTKPVDQNSLVKAVEKAQQARMAV